MIALMLKRLEKVQEPFEDLLLAKIHLNLVPSSATQGELKLYRIVKMSIFWQDTIGCSLTLSSGCITELFSEPLVCALNPELCGRLRHEYAKTETTIQERITPRL
jgi:hypothetical protein